MSAAYEMVVGLETHVQLNTASKLFCGCANRFAAAPNSCVCPVCLGFPGAMPALNGAAVELAIKAGLMLGCEISESSGFDRKNYFYADAPKNYQLTQHFKPLCTGGGVEIALVGGGVKRVRLHHMHIEEDVAKSVHRVDCSGIDFNRAGVPLIEIVTMPDISTADEAAAFLTALRQLLRYAAVSECNLEEGNLRCDINISMRPAGTTQLGVRVELKNLNTISGAHAAITYERDRQIGLLESGGHVGQETRRWDAASGSTVLMRAKEDAQDYRCFADPDLPLLAVDMVLVEKLRRELPETPAHRRARLVSQYQVADYDAAVLTDEQDLADYFEQVAQACGNGKMAANWIITDVLRLVAMHDTPIGASRLQAGVLAELLTLVEKGTINGPTAKKLLEELFVAGGAVAEMVATRGLAQIQDEESLTKWVEQVLADNRASVADWLAGKKAAASFLVGQVMKLSRGRADPKAVGRLVEEHLTNIKPEALLRQGAAMESYRDIK